MAKENKSKLIIWATVALVIGVILGLLITNITTTGKAKSAVSEAQYRNADIYLFGELRLDQWFDNVGNYYNTHYYFYQYEHAESNVPATLEKDSQVTHNLNTSGNMSTSQLNLNDYGTYSTNGFSYMYIPFTQNNLTVYSSINGNFIFGNGQNSWKHQEFVANQNGDAFAEVTAFDFGCNGQYQMTHTDAGDLSDVHFYLSIYTSDYSSAWNYDWDQTPQRNYNYMGYFPQEAINILSDGSDYVVSITSNIHTTSGNLTTANTGKEINCQTGKSTGLSSEQLEELKEKTGNTPKQIAEKFSSEQMQK